MKRWNQLIVVVVVVSAVGASFTFRTVSEVLQTSDLTERSQIVFGLLIMAIFTAAMAYSMIGLIKVIQPKWFRKMLKEMRPGE